MLCNNVGQGNTSCEPLEGIWHNYYCFNPLVKLHFNIVPPIPFFFLAFGIKLRSVMIMH